MDDSKENTITWDYDSGVDNSTPTIDLSSINVTPYTYSVGTTIGANGTFSSPYISTNISSGKLSICGEDADIDINGKSMKAWMERVEERLNILTPNTELEQDWDNLRKLGERYRRLEKKINEKMATWSKLTGSDKDNR
jgi:hypothetical protein